MSQFSLSWDAYSQSICNGLSALQQNGEFVDMTLAADGHHVKVHRMVLSLVSPYIKELLASAQCPHPVLFLNKISYATLSSILEYVYTGEVHVSKENLSEVIKAGKELHIRGLEDMKIELLPQLSTSQSIFDKRNEGKLSETGYLRSGSQSNGVNTMDGVNEDEKPCSKISNTNKSKKHSLLAVFLNEGGSQIDDFDDDIQFDNANDTDVTNTDVDTDELDTKRTVKKNNDASIQYTISNQGAVQMVLNRYLYNMRYCKKGVNAKGHRMWRCVDYIRQHLKCPAAAVTSSNDVVLNRTAVHNHPFHDKKIMKKVREKALFKTIHAAETTSRDKIIYNKRIERINFFSKVPPKNVDSDTIVK